MEWSLRVHCSFDRSSHHQRVRKLSFVSPCFPQRYTVVIFPFACQSVQTCVACLRFDARFSCIPSQCSSRFLKNEDRPSWQKKLRCWTPVAASRLHASTHTLVSSVNQNRYQSAQAVLVFPRCVFHVPNLECHKEHFRCQVHWTPAVSAVSGTLSLKSGFFTTVLQFLALWREAYWPPSLRWDTRTVESLGLHLESHFFCFVLQGRTIWQSSVAVRNSGTVACSTPL